MPMSPSPWEMERSPETMQARNTWRNDVLQRLNSRDPSTRRRIIEKLGSPTSKLMAELLGAVGYPNDESVLAVILLPILAVVIGLIALGMMMDPATEPYALWVGIFVMPCGYFTKKFRSTVHTGFSNYAPIWPGLATLLDQLEDPTFLPFALRALEQRYPEVLMKAMKKQARQCLLRLSHEQLRALCLDVTVLRTFLYSQQNYMDTAVELRILKFWATVGAISTLPYVTARANDYAFSSEQRVGKKAAQECLQVLEELAQKRLLPETLLRASSPSVSPDTLLRAAVPAETMPPDQLLRSSDSSPSPTD